MISLDPAVYPVGVATASLGMHPSQTLEVKFAALQKAGFTFTEVGFGNYMEWVRQQVPDLPASTCPPEWQEADEPDPSDEIIWETLYSKAADLISLASSYGLKVLGLQPLNQFDGWPEGSERGEWVKRKAEKWLGLCSALQVDFIQVGSNDYAEANGGDEKTARDLHWLAEVGANQPHPVKIAYESWCFSSRVSDWEHTWKIVQLGNHPNLGLCIDTAQAPLAPAYGWNPNTGEGWTDTSFSAMIERLRQVPGEKIFYLEISDALKPVVPLGQGSPFDPWKALGKTNRNDVFIWAACGRPVPFIGRNAGKGVKSEDDLGGARVLEQVQAVLATGFKGPIMYEVFETMRMEEAEDVPTVYADACAKSHEILLSRLT